MYGIVTPVTLFHTQLMNLQRALPAVPLPPLITASSILAVGSVVFSSSVYLAKRRLGRPQRVH